jgi:hypothetical protein
MHGNLVLVLLVITPAFSASNLSASILDICNVSMVISSSEIPLKFSSGLSLVEQELKIKIRQRLRCCFFSNIVGMQDVILEQKKGRPFTERPFLTCLIR